MKGVTPSILPERPGHLVCRFNPLGFHLVNMLIVYYEKSIIARYKLLSKPIKRRISSDMSGNDKKFFRAAFLSQSTGGEKGEYKQHSAHFEISSA